MRTADIALFGISKLISAINQAIDERYFASVIKTSHTWFDVVVSDSYIVASVVPHVLMPESDHMHQLMNHNIVLNTGDHVVRLQHQHVSTMQPPNRRITSRVFSRLQQQYWTTTSSISQV